MQVILLLINLAVIIVIMLLLTNFIYGAFRYVPYVPSKREAVKKMLKIANIRSGETVYDLGCGDGRLVITAAKEHDAKATGYEAALSIYLLAKLKNAVSRSKAIISPQNFFSVDMSDADVVFCYLFPHVMNKLKKKFEQELKPGTRVISNSFEIKGWIPTRVEQTYPNKPHNSLIREYVIGKSNTMKK
jgi:SAM-dependent methyltransferase